MTTAERRSLQDQIGATPSVSAAATILWSLVWIVSLVSLVALAGLVFSSLKRVDAALAGVVGGIPILAAIICLYGLIAVISGHLRWSRVHRTFERSTLPLLKRALERGEVRTKRVVASSVIEIQEVEDEGPGYIFNVGDSRSLLLKGQRYLPVEQSMPWPASEFEIVRGMDEELWIGIFSKGDPLEPVTTVTTAQCRAEFAWSVREDVVEGEPQAVLRALAERARPGERS